jgi:uncharacterized membrane protein
MTARDVRGKAWLALSSGSWFKAFFAFFLLWMIGHTVDRLLLHAGVLTGHVSFVTAADLARLLAMPAVPPEWSAIRIPRPTLLFQCVKFLIDGMVAGGILAAGWAVFAVALVRDGAHVMHVFSGFARPVRTAGLGVLLYGAVAFWSLFLLVPGVRAFYSYRMAFYLLADHPDWSPVKALRESKKMMEGHRWRLACLDLSFVGWMVLEVMTLGLASVLVRPYRETAVAVFYEDLLDLEEQDA